MARVSNALNSLAEAKLKASGLLAHKRELHIEILTAESMEALGLAARGGLLLPYHDAQGRRTSFFRVRYLEDPPPNSWGFKDKKPQRYAQPAGTVNEIYLAPIVPWAALLSDSQFPLVITEGELKAACACAQDIATIGLGGVWNFRAAKHGLPLLPQLEAIAWQGREVYICFDSDAVTNSNVAAAEACLCRVLSQQGAKARIIRLPSLAEGQKTGLDDWLMAQDDPRGAFEKLMATGEELDRLTAELHGMNSELIVIKKPGCVMTQDGKHIYKFSEFVNVSYSNRTVDVTFTDAKGNAKVKTVDVAREWLKWPGRNQAEAMAYEPGQGSLLPDGSFNLWRGWRYEPVQGDVQPFLDLLDYIFKGDKKSMQWFLQWLAYPVQHPGTKLYSACVLWGAQGGTGKSLLGEILDQLYSPHSAIINEERLDGRFNAWQEGVSFCIGEEITGNDSHTFANKLKDMVTRQFVFVEHKGVDATRLRDCTNYLLFSNRPGAVKLDVQDRRYFVWETPREKLDTAVGTAISRAMKSEAGMQALMHFLLNVDTSDFEPKAAPPVTASKLAMISDGLSEVERWIASMHEHTDWELATAEELLKLFEPDETRRKLRANGMTRALKSMSYYQVNRGMGVRLTNGQQPHVFAIAASASRREELLCMPAPSIKKLYESERKRSKIR